MSDESEEFSYQGYLVFNGIYNVDLNSQSEYHGSLNEVESRLVKQLGQFEERKQDSEKGVEKLLLRDYFRDDDSVSGDLEDLADSLIALRFLYENKVKKRGYLKGKTDLQTVEIPVINDADIYWDYPDHIYFRGAEDDVTEAIEYTSKLMGVDTATDGGSASGSTGTPAGYTRFKNVSFHRDFLLWIFFNHFNDNDLPKSDIEIDSLTDAAVTGDIDVWGGNNRVGDTTELTESPPLLSALLQNKSLNMLEGGFAINDNTLMASIQVNKTHIKASSKSIRTSNNTRRLALSLKFLRELVELEETWSSLAPKEKYPPYNFFLEIFDMCRDQGMTLDSIDEMMRRDYCNKRGDPDTSWDL